MVNFKRALLQVLPDNLSGALAQGSAATQRAMQSGASRCLVELLLPELWDPNSGAVFAGLPRSTCPQVSTLCSQPWGSLLTVQQRSPCARTVVKSNELFYTP
jgi:hypothetical protein